MSNFKIAFWNVNNKFPIYEIEALLRERELNILALIECKETISDIGKKLPSIVNGIFKVIPEFVESNGIVFITRIDNSTYSRCEDDDRYSIIDVTIPNFGNLIIATVHLPSKLHSDEDSQRHLASRYHNKIKTMEMIKGHKNCIVMGDFNMSPFESGMIHCNGFNSTIDSKIAKRVRRIYMGEEYEYFYNPSWHLYGNIITPGSYWYHSVNAEAIQWHIFDQVIIRPKLINYFTTNSLTAITNIGGKSLVIKDTNRPNKSKYSDHLPITFSLNTRNI